MAESAALAPYVARSLWGHGHGSQSYEILAFSICPGYKVVFLEKVISQKSNLNYIKSLEVYLKFMLHSSSKSLRPGNWLKNVLL